MHLHRRTLRLSLHADPVDLWLAQPRETFWYKMLLKEFESVDSLERMDKSDEARCIDGWFCQRVFIYFE